MEKGSTISGLRHRYILLLLAAVTAGLYCSSLIEITLKPGVIGGVDDDRLMQHLLNHTLTIRDIFSVSNPGKYFRPFLWLTYLIDQKLWGETIFGYRFTNVVLHTCNSLFVYMIGRKIFSSSVDRVAVSLSAAILFAVHPLAVESVSWISGRTDLMSTFWALLAFYFCLSAKDGNTAYMSMLTIFSALAAALSKETGVVFFILIIGWQIHYRKFFGFHSHQNSALIFALPLLIVGIFYVFLRFKGLASRDVSMDMIVNSMLPKNILESSKLFIASYGFYIKKFFSPFPLQFAIDAIHVAAYAILGAAALIVLGSCMLLPLAGQYGFFIFWIFIGLMPAALVSSTHIAWTPWAERYLYFSLVPLSFISAMGVSRVMERWQELPRRVLSFCVAVVLVVFGFSSVQRSHLWNDDEEFWHDAFTKTPKFTFAAVEYGRALREKGKIDEAEQQFQRAASLSGPKHLLLYQLGMLKIGKGDHEGAKEHFLEALDEARSDKNLILMGPSLRKNILTSIADLEMNTSRSCSEKKRLYQCYKKIIQYLREAHREDPSDAFLLYRIGKLYLASGKKEEARGCFEEFIAKWDDDVYRQTAEKMLRKIKAVHTDARAVLDGQLWPMREGFP